MTEFYPHDSLDDFAILWYSSDTNIHPYIMVEISNTKRTAIESIISGRKEKLDEYSLSQVFIYMYKDQAHYCTSWGQFLLYQGEYYKRYTKNEHNKLLKEIIVEFFPDKVSKIRKSFLDGARELIEILFPSTVEDEELAHNYIAFKDCLYNTDTMEQTPYTPAILCFKYVDVEAGQFDEPHPAFDEYLETTIVDDNGVFDPELMDLYQETLGALFSGHRGANRAFFFYGNASAGKSVTTEWILDLFQKEYRSSASLEELSRQFGQVTLIGKIVNVCTEEESSYLKHSVIKALVTGEQIQSSVKFGESVAFRNFAKMIFATNDFPKFSGLDDAMKRRIIILPFNASFVGDDIDYDMPRKLREESAQIVAFALKGLRRLQANNYQYTIGTASKQVMEYFQEESSPVARYLKEEIEVDTAKVVEPLSANTIYAHYREWCRDNGHKTVASNRFAREMGYVDWLKPYKTRPSGISLYYIHLPTRKLPDVL